MRAVGEGDGRVRRAAGRERGAVDRALEGRPPHGGGEAEGRRRVGCHDRGAGVDDAVRVGGAGCEVAGEDEVRRGPVVIDETVSGGDDPAVALDRDAAGLRAVAEVGHRLAVGGEAAIEVAVGVDAGDRKTAAEEARPVGEGPSRGDDPAVGLDRDRESEVGAAEVVGLGAAGEVAVERAVAAVAGEREVKVAVVVVPCVAGGDDLAVGLDPDRAGLVDAAEVGLDLAVVVEAAVERAVEVVAGECEVVVAVAVVVVVPATTILPPRSSAAPRANSSLPKLVICLPSPEKLVSSEPFGS